MYPTGSNGASQAIVDARILGAAMLQHGVSAQALQAYDERLCPEDLTLDAQPRCRSPLVC